MMLDISSSPYSDHYSCIDKMKVIFVVVFAALVLVKSAPSPSQVPGTIDPRQEYYREVRSQYQQYPQYPQYVTPCAAAAAAAAAASAPIPAIAPAAAYQLNVAPYHGYAQPSQYYGHYRSAEEPEIMNYSDMDHMMSEHMQARYGYHAPRSYPPVSTTGPVFGVFPNANSGGCNVPLLFSCTPSVVPGHVVPQQQYAADAYRGVEPAVHHEAIESHEESAPVAHEHLNPAVPNSNHAMTHQ